MQITRYNDGTQRSLYHYIEAGNLEGVRVIRTAYSVYKTISEIKKAEGARALTAKMTLNVLSPI